LFTRFSPLALISLLKKYLFTSRKINNFIQLGKLPLVLSRFKALKCQGSIVFFLKKIFLSHQSTHQHFVKKNKRAPASKASPSAKPDQESEAKSRGALHQTHANSSIR
jgi:hypothetical protein